MSISFKMRNVSTAIVLDRSICVEKIVELDQYLRSLQTFGIMWTRYSSICGIRTDMEQHVHVATLVWDLPRRD